MSALSFSAPGKLYLLGEYAVLDGAPALLRSVDRRVTVTLCESQTKAGWSLTAPELRLNQLELGPDALLPADLSDASAHELRLFDEVRTAVDALAPAKDSYAITIESAAFLQNGHKLGLGSSAAVAVALTAALATSRGCELTRSEIFTVAARAHSAAQGGKGSGGDIAASVYGGHILFRKGSEPLTVSWPENLELFAVTTGTGSSTVDLVSRVAEYADQNPAAHDRDIHHLRSLAEQAETALTNADDFLALANAYFLGVEVLDSHAQAGIVTDRHRELRDIAAASGAVFKTSGAGGGDVGLVFAKLDSAGHLQSVYSEAGATVIPVPFSSHGVQAVTA
ncbi:MAG: hypothetical protein ABIW32_09450 [Terrimesophilobacter sp.]